LEGKSDDLNGFLMLSVKVENFKKIEQNLWEEILMTEKESRADIKDDYFGKNKDDIFYEANPQY
jgi:transposase